MVIPNHRNRYVECKTLNATSKMKAVNIEASGIRYVKDDGTSTVCDLNALSQFNQSQSDMLNSLQSQATSEITGEFSLNLTEAELSAMSDAEIDTMVASVLDALATESGGTVTAN